MKILLAPQIREADAYTVANEPVTPQNLMERAAAGCARWMKAHLEDDAHVVIFCGTGNNGGDGLALARLLHEETSLQITTFVCGAEDKLTPETAENLKRLRKRLSAGVHVIQRMDDLFHFVFDEQAVFVDALFGTGLNRPLTGFYEELVHWFNRQHQSVIAIDTPSGLYADDNTDNDFKTVIQAAHTLTFQAPKLAFMFAENSSWVQHFRVIDIGLHPEFMARVNTNYHYITPADIAGIFQPRPKFGHKGNFGHALLAAGSRGKMGAAVLAASAALRAGAGLVTTFIPKCGYNIMQTAQPVAMVTESESDNHLSGNFKTDAFDAIGIGPGIGLDDDTQHLLKRLLQDTTAPLVLDADALNILAANKTWLHFLPKNSILTPHPGEFDRLTENHTRGYDRMLDQREMAMKLGVIIVLKGAHTSIALPDGRVFFNSSGNPGMAKAGSGDVLTGIITAFVAQGYAAPDAAILGVFVHGLAGDIMASENAEESLTATDIIQGLAPAFRQLHEWHRQHYSRELH